jgi:signal transduction histidine kinase
MFQDNVSFIISCILAVFYLMLGYLATQRSAGYGRITIIMIIYAIVSSIWQLGAAYLSVGLSDLPLVNAWGHSVGLLLLNVLILAATIEYLNLEKRFIPWVIFGAVWSFLVILVIAGLIPLPAQWIPSIFWLILFGSGFTLILAISLTIRAMGKESRTALRTKTRYWLFALFLLVPADMVIFLSSDWIGDLLRMISVLITGSLIFIRSRDDFTWTVRRIVAFLVTLLSVFFILLALSRLKDADGLEENRWLSTSLFFDAFFAFYLLPVVLLIANTFNRSFLGLGYNQGVQARNFISKIGSGLSLESLTVTVIDEINQLFSLENSALIVADRHESDRVYLLISLDQLLNKETTEQVPYGLLKFSDPLVKHLIDTKHPIERTDTRWVDFNDRLNESHRTLLGEFPFEIFAPIVLHDDLVGILALGPKKSHERYLPADMELLGMLTEQMAAILVNARLLDNTLRLNLELKSAQEEILKSNEKLRELDEMKTAFIGVITHELRTPLANIQFSSQVLEMYFKRIVTPEQRQQFNELNSAVRTARMMIDNLINFAAFLNEKVSLNIQEFDFGEALKDVLVPLKPTVEAKNLRLQVNMIGDSFMVQADPILLREAVNQMVSNAIKFTRTGGVHIVCWTTTEALCFDVEDTGIGIEEERLNQVWDAFTQLQADSVKRGLEGLGLGLSLVKYIVKAHGGHVWVESTVGSGSIFGFQIPLRGPAHSLPELTQRPQRLRIPSS